MMEGHKRLRRGQTWLTSLAVGPPLDKSMKPLAIAPTSFVSILALACAVLAACSSSGGPPGYATAAAVAAEPSDVFWGDTHLHTCYSPDAFFFGNTTADPDTALI